MNTQYKPKAIRGQTFTGYIKVSVIQVEKLYKSGQIFKGFIVGNKVNAFHFFNGWNLACRLSDESTTNFEAFKRALNSFNFYLDSELGNRVAIYLAKGEI